MFPRLVVAFGRPAAQKTYPFCRCPISFHITLLLVVAVDMLLPSVSTSSKSAGELLAMNLMTFCRHARFT